MSVEFKEYLVTLKNIFNSNVKEAVLLVSLHVPIHQYSRTDAKH